MDDRYDLQRFVTAQDEGGTYDGALAELWRGRKTGHWMWFVFPQIAGLGQSAMSQRYAITSLDEAKAYAAHLVLGSRLRESASAVLSTQAGNAEQILGGIDAMKLHSSMTLFSRAVPNEPVFSQVLDRFFDGEADQATESRLRPRHTPEEPGAKFSH